MPHALPTPAPASTLAVMPVTDAVDGRREQAVRPGIADRLAQQIRIRTVSAHRDRTGEQPFRTFRTLLAQQYPRVHAECDIVRVGGSGMLWHWPGRDSAHPLVLLAHYDVVPADEVDRWTHPPFDGVICDGTVWGRGAIDDKGELVTVLDALENLIAAGAQPARDVWVFSGGTEEYAGGEGGDDASAAVAYLLERGVEPWLVLDEGGAVVDDPLPGVRLHAAMIGLGEKGIATIRLTTLGEPGHASAPPRTSAPGRMARALSRIERTPFPRRLTPAIRGALRAFARGSSGGRGLDLQSLGLRMLAAVPPLGATVLGRMGGLPAALVGTTVAITRVESGTAINVLAGDASATLNVRILPGETVASVVERLRRVIADGQVELTVLEASDPSPMSPLDDRWDAIRSALQAGYPHAEAVPYLMVQASDSRHFHAHWPHVYRFAPLTMNAEQRASLHGIDEHVTIDALERGERFMRALMHPATASPATASRGSL